jgi:hypothetical protein
MTTIYCPICEDGELEAEVYTDSEGCLEFSHSFLVVDLQTDTCTEGCKLDKQDQQKAIDRAAEQAQYYSGEY